MPDAVIPVNDVQSMLDTNWNTQNGVLPEPNYLIVNSGTEPIRYDLNRGDYIIIKTGVPSENEMPIGTWIYATRIWPIVVEIATKNSRQRLWNMKDEIRRICHSQMHSLTNFQRVQYKQFSEMVEDQQLVWHGRVEIELQSAAVLMEV